ncbi:TonB-dependent receptor plug domain-containing protein [candidate division KSB1 bacterium]|nr:TonB-dependent receptor plug domain-containing protein [candidate division KSB1 bacterium]
MKRSSFFVLVATVFALVLLMVVPNTFAATTGKIAGRIVDAETGEPLPGVNVQLVGLPYGAATDVDGYFYIINVRPGRYKIKASYIGYESVTMENVQVIVDRTTPLDFKLRTTVLEAGAEVTVVAERAIVPLDVANSQQVIEPEEIESNAFSDIGSVVFAQVGIERTTNNDRPSIRGAGFNESQFVVDGLSMVDEISNAPVYKIPLGAIQEVNVITGGFNAEYGNVRSGVINIVTKDGGDQFAGSVNFKYSPPGLKHFGPVAFGGDSPLVEPFTKASNGAWTGYLPDGTENDFFDGWYSYSGIEVDELGNPIKNADGSYQLGENGVVKPGAPHYGNPYENLALYLWRHRSMDNLNHLRELADKGLIDADLSNVSDEDAVFEYGDEPDYLGEFTLGGPVPFVDKLRFFASYASEQTEYSTALPQPTYNDHNATFKLTYPLTEAIKLQGNFMYSWVYGSNSNESTQGPGAGGYISNNPFQRPLGNKQWYPHCQVPGKQNRYFGGLSMTHVLSPSTFYELHFQTALTDYQMDQYHRNTQPVAGSPYGVRYLDQGRIGTEAEANERAASDDPKWYGYENWRNWAKVRIGDYWYDESPWGYGPTQFRDLTGYFRMSSCNIRIDQSMARWYNLKGSITSQMNRFNLVKAGFEIKHDRIHMHYDAIDPSVNGGSQQFAFANPFQVSAYIQDKLEFQGMIANVGVRLDWLHTDDRITFNDDPTDKEQGPYSMYMEAGHRQDYEKFNFESHDQVTISPRIGISHPISEDAKLFFNYGHFYKWAETDEMYRVYRSTRRGDRIDRIGNPMVSPPRTIQYEIGYAQNILDAARVQITGYYRDITDEVRETRYYYLSGFNYRTYTNNRYKDVRGFELNVDFPGNKWVSGWLNYNYMISSRGEYGYDRFYEDPTRIPRRRGLGVSQAKVRPVYKANMTFHTPADFGPGLAGYHLLEAIDFGFLYWRKDGPTFTWNPDGIPYVVDNKQWSADWRIDLRFTKRLFKWKNIEPVFYVDVFNLTDHKHLPYWGDNDYSNRRVWNAYKWFRNEQEEYMYSLKEGEKPGTIEGDHIDLPDFTPWMYFNKRDIFYGVRFNFMF